MLSRITSLVTYIASLAILTNAIFAEDKAKPLFKDFIGINGHTVQFKPELYKNVCRVVRDYHPMDWDTGKDSDYKLDFPFARNRVNWDKVYGVWKTQGFDIDVCVMFETLKEDSWKSLPRDAEAYGKKFAAGFGPSSSKSLVHSVEIGNEPGKYSDNNYRQVFESMAKGIRSSDPQLKIATCNVNVGKSGDYHKSVDCVKGLENLYDILNIHSYAMLEGWPTWKRSFPEDPNLAAFTQDIARLIEWRNTHAAGKEIWLTEFGWDSSTKLPIAKGDFAKWQGNSDLEQAQWLVRSFFVFAKLDIERAYIYFFNDSDTPQFHGSSGLTRNFEPKPSFYAVQHLYQTLGDYRFARVVRESHDGNVFEFSHEFDRDKLIWVAWSPTGNQTSSDIRLPLEGLNVIAIEQMPVDASGPVVAKEQHADGLLMVNVSESPKYIRLTK